MFSDKSRRHMWSNEKKKRMKDELSSVRLSGLYVPANYMLVCSSRLLTKSGIRAKRLQKVMFNWKKS